MSFKLKFAAVAVFASLFASSAFALDYAVDNANVAADSNALAIAEFTATTLAADGNVAIINQESSGNAAFIDQSGATNFAAIQQATNDSNMGVIYQIGDSNKASIYQH